MKTIILFILIFIFYINFVNHKFFFNKFPDSIEFDTLDFINLINNINFIGNWKGKISNNLLNNKSGRIKFNINKREYKLFKNYTTVTELLTKGKFIILDSEYYDENVIEIEVTLKKNKTNKINTLDYVNKEKSNIFQLKYTNKIKFIKCDINVNINFNNEIIVGNKIILEKLLNTKNSLNISINDNNCGLNLDAKLNYDNKSNLTEYYYLIFIFAISLINFISSIKLIKNLNFNPNLTKSVNMLTILITCCIDLFLCFFNITLSIENNDFLLGKYLYLTPSFLYFLIFTLIDLNILYLIWKTMNLDLFYNNISEFKKRIQTFDINIKFLSLIFIILFFKFYLSPYIILAISFLLFPQIYHYCKNGMIFDIDYNYIIYCCLKFIILIYFRLFKSNLLLLKPYYFLMITSIFVIIFSILVIYAQSYFGPKFFLPKFFNKNKYDYFSINSKVKNNIIKKLENANKNNNEVIFLIFI